MMLQIFVMSLSFTVPVVLDAYRRVTLLLCAVMSSATKVSLLYGSFFIVIFVRVNVLIAFSIVVIVVNFNTG